MLSHPSKQWRHLKENRNLNSVFEKADRLQKQKCTGRRFHEIAPITLLLIHVEDSMMEQMVNFSTQVKGNCLDFVITNIPERVSEVSEAGRLGRSDRDMLCITLDF
jgi:hypothetical protein